MRRRRGCCCLWLLALLLLLLCAGSLALAAWTTGPSGACNRPQSGPPQPGTSVRTLVSNGQERCYLLHVPSSGPPVEPVPLVLSLHGFAERPRLHVWMTGWNKIADEHGFVLVYPHGTGSPLRWNASGPAGDVDVDDVQFVRDLVAEVESLVRIDRRRVYVNGLSNGGAMTYRLACEAADLVAAAGTVAAPVGELPGGCAPSRPVPLVAFHGTADWVVPYEGDSGRGSSWPQRLGLARGHFSFLPARQWTAEWAARNGCSPTPEAIAPSGDTSGIRYTGCDAEAEVLLYSVDGGGHTWPGGLPLPLVGKTSRDIDASEIMWQFFSRYRLAGP
jgi:polyhydroxybutyrate depolymerase